MTSMWFLLQIRGCLMRIQTALSKKKRRSRPLTLPLCDVCYRGGADLWHDLYVIFVDLTSMWYFRFRDVQWGSRQHSGGQRGGADLWHDLYATSPTALPLLFTGKNSVIHLHCTIRRISIFSCSLIFISLRNEWLSF